MASPACENHDGVNHAQLLPFLHPPQQPPPYPGCFRSSSPRDLSAGTFVAMFKDAGFLVNDGLLCDDISKPSAAHKARDFEAVFKDAGFLAKDGLLCDDICVSSMAHKATEGDANSAESSMSSFFVPSSSDDEEDSSTCSSSSSLSQSTQDSSQQDGPLNNLTSLSAALPIKRGLSRFFSGKSQSFSSLARVSSVADLAKPENPFVKRRRMLVDGSHGSGKVVDSYCPKHQSYPPPSRWACGTTASSQRHPTINRFRGSKPLLLPEQAALQSGAKPKPRPAKCFSVPALQKAGL